MYGIGIPRRWLEHGSEPWLPCHVHISAATLAAEVWSAVEDAFPSINACLNTFVERQELANCCPRVYDKRQQFTLGERRQALQALEIRVT
jgi:hypothetical protein